MTTNPQISLSRLESAARASTKSKTVLIRGEPLEVASTEFGFLYRFRDQYVQRSEAVAILKTKGSP